MNPLQLAILRSGIFVTMLLSAAFLTSCNDESNSEPPPPTEQPPSPRAGSIPSDAVKQTPSTDLFPPVVHSPLWEPPVPMPGPVNTAGAEDAPILTPDGDTFIFFFTPDVRVPPQGQILDSVTGIWWSRLVADQWTEPQRIVLHDNLSLDGPFGIAADTLWFGSIRLGNYRDDGDIFVAERHGDSWVNWRNAGSALNFQYNIGELYPTGDNRTMIFSRYDTLGFGGYDLWKTEKTDTSWSEPINLGPPVNTGLDESRPYLSPDGRELWFTGWSRLGYQGPCLYRTLMTDSGWTNPEEIVSNFAGDPGLDAAGNLYFTHSFFSDSMTMIEGDIYLARRR